MKVEEITSGFNEIIPNYAALSTKLSALLKDLAEVSDIKFHVIEARPKTLSSFLEKIQRPGKNYEKPLQQVPDLCGVRIIVYYQDDVETIGNLITREFDIIEKELSHSAEHYLPDQFGYLSAHYIATLSKERLLLAEWRRFKDHQFEIQVRTVLQHGWATISHALQYKREEDVPRQLRRKLFRLAGLFELADEEFLNIRDAKIKTEKIADDAVKQGYLEIAIDSASVKAFIENWSGLPELIKTAQTVGFEFDPLFEDSRYFGDIAEICNKVNIKTIAEMEKTLPKYNQYKDYLKQQMNRTKNEAPAEATWVVNSAFLVQLILLKSLSDKISASFLDNLGWSLDTAEKVMKVAKA